jgi:PadR family transcriptional regulator, regulatory protein PadR
VLSCRAIVPAETMLRDFFLGFVKIHILHHAAEEPVYGLALLEELRHHGYDLSPGTIYPILHGLEQSGYLQRDERLVAGKVRKYYSATPAGRHALADIRHKIRELTLEVLDQAPTAAATSSRAARGSG